MIFREAEMTDLPRVVELLVEGSLRKRMVLHRMLKEIFKTL